MIYSLAGYGMAMPLRTSSMQHSTERTLDMCNSNVPQAGQHLGNFPGFRGTLDGEVIDERTGKPVPVTGGTLKVDRNGDTYS